MKNVGKWMLGAALAVGGLGLAATPAHAAQFGVYIGAGQAAYVPPSPGPGYQWVAGYYDGYGNWVPGQWVYAGGPAYYGAYYGGGYYGGGYYRHHDDDDDYRGWRGDDWHHDRGEHRGWDRGEGWHGDRGEHRGRGGDHFRGGDRGHDRR